MSLIKNLLKESENKDKSESKIKNNDNQDKIRPIIRTATDMQRLKLEKLMKNPDKPVVIPEPRGEKDYLNSVPSFVRNVMGSSAGAGSGEFHVYRHLRRKEYARQKTIQAKSLKEQLDEEYQQKIEQNRQHAEEKTAKKRAKRLKKKMKQRNKCPRQNNTLPHVPNSATSSDENEITNEINKCPRQNNTIPHVPNSSASSDENGITNVQSIETFNYSDADHNASESLTTLTNPKTDIIDKSQKVDKQPKDIL